MYAVIITGGKQYKVQEGDIIFIEKLNVEADDTVKFDNVLMVSGDQLLIGSDAAAVTVDAKVVKNGKGKKIKVFKFKAKKNYRKLKGHRQPYTKVEITKINA